MDQEVETSGASRRDVLKGGALGMGALATVLGVGGLAASGSAAAAPAVLDGTFDYFLKLDGISGDSIDADRKGEISLLSFSWGASAAVDSMTGISVGRARLADFHFTSPTSIASPNLFLATMSGKSIKTGLLSVRRQVDNQGAEYIKLRLSSIMVSSFHMDGNGDAPVDTATLHFQKCDLSVFPVNVDGALGTPTTGAFG